MAKMRGGLRRFSALAAVATTSSVLALSTNAAPGKRFVSSTSVAAALACAKRGPAWQALQRALDPPPPAEDWAYHGEALTEAITGRAAPADAVDSPTAARVYQLCLPIYFFCRELVSAHQASGGSGALAIGLSAPQGCGKTTLVDALVARFAADSLSCAVVSFDDFYHTGSAQDAVAAASPDNPMLQVRGNAGTHDLALGTATLRALKDGASGSDGGGARDDTPLLIPRYDKAARGGRGDRAPAESWPEVADPPDVVLLEGWMAGFAPLPPDAPVLSRHPGLHEVNELLNRYEEWHAQMDAWVVLAVEDPECVYTWRLQAEQAMAAAGRPGMSDEQVADFVSRYMPSYCAFLPELYSAACADGVDGKPTLLVQVDETRSPVARRAPAPGAD